MGLRDEVIELMEEVIRKAMLLKKKFRVWVNTNGFK